MKKSEKGRVERMRSIENSLRSSANKLLTGPSSQSGAFELLNFAMDIVDLYHIHHNINNVQIEEAYLGWAGDVHPGEALPELGPAPGARHARPVPRHASRDQPPPTPRLRGLRPILSRLRALILWMLITIICIIN